MDIFPRSNEAAAAISNYDRRCKNVCAIDTNHRCSDACEYYVCDKTRVAVCKTSRHTHVCSKFCTLTTRERDGRYCRLTAFQVNGPEEEAHINSTRITFGQRHSNVHWGPAPTRAAKAKPANTHAKRVRAMLSLLFVSKDRRRISNDTIDKVRKKMTALLHRRTVGAYCNALAYRCKMSPGLKPVPQSIPETFAQYIIIQTERIRNECARRKIPCKRTDASLVLGLLQLLNTGFSACGACIIPKSDYVARHSLSVQQYGLIPGIRCRSQTISTRLVKKAVLTEDGEPLLTLPPSPV